MKLFIKYMVCIRCKMVVKAEVEKLGFQCCKIELGEVDVVEQIPPEKLLELKNALLLTGLELMDDKKSVLIAKIKNVIIEMVHYADELPRVKNSEYIGKKLGHDYTYLANLFSEATGVTIEHFIIAHKIEKVKEYLLYDEMNLTEISYRLNYSSVAHLSNQFKKVTGLTPTFFKQLKEKKRIDLDKI